MAKRLKRPIAFVAAVAMLMTMLLYLPSGIFKEIGFGQLASAEEITPTEPSKDANDVYQIGTAAELYWFANKVGNTYGYASAKAVLTADITVNTGDVAGCNGIKAENWIEWTPIGTNTFGYTGTFDGQGHTVSGLYLNNNNKYYAGLFGNVGEAGSVSNVGVINSYINCSESGGGVCGNNKGTITNCYNEGTVSGNSYVGGVCGDNRGTIENCYNKGTISGGNNIGGVCGQSYYGTITNCYNTGNVSGLDTIGGVCGLNNNSTISSCYNTGKLTGTGTESDAGGVCGYNFGGTITNSYNKGNVIVTNDGNNGGVCGLNNARGIITNCYNSGEVSGARLVGGVCGCAYGNISNCYSDKNRFKGNAIGGNGATLTNVETKTTVQFTSGEVAYLLSQGCTIGEGESAVDYDGSVWGQNIGADSSPVIGGSKVYPVEATFCDGTTSGTVYSNTNEPVVGAHTYDNGFCTYCGVYEPAYISDGVYEILNAGQLYWFAGLVNGDESICTEELPQNTSANAVLTANITVNTGDVAGYNGIKAENWIEWTPIGTNTYEYTGTFDGNGKTVSGLYFNDTNDTNYVGLFGYIGFDYDDEGNKICGKVSDVGVINSYFNGSRYIGGVCGYNHYGTIENCHNEGFVSGSSYVGGLCGWNESGTIINCYNSGEIKELSEITGTFIAGGICGQNVGTIENCHNKGNISPSNYAGGICGWNGYKVINCYNTGAISATRNNAYVGGVSGNHSGMLIANCYNIGTVNGTGDYVGGVCGVKNSTSIINCYYLANKADENGGRTSAQFNRGEVAYLLSLGCEKYGNTFDGSIWGQNIGTDNYPVLGGAVVYPTAPCLSYTNNPEETVKDHPKYINGFCSDCGVYKVAEQNEDGYYEISNAGQLLWFAELVNNENAEANAILTDNITINSNLLSSLEYNAEGNVTNGDSFTVWTPIGTSSNIYAGIFDGNGKTVSGLYVNAASTDYIGLFGYNSGTINNVGVIDSYFEGRQYVGGVCGYNYSDYAKMINCYNTGEISGKNNVGGVSGNNDGEITDCYNTGAVVGNGDNVGGVCGYNYSDYAKMINCYNTGEISGKNNVGGVSGNNDGEITDCYNTGNVNGSDKVGGVCGYNKYGYTISCYNTGKVSGSYKVGGVCGFNDVGEIKNCYNTGAVKGTGNETYVGGVCGYNNNLILNSYNSGCVTATGENTVVGGVSGYNEWKIINCYFNSNNYSGDAVGTNNEGTVTDVEGKTTAQFESGEVTFLLSQGCKIGNNTFDGSVWGQDLETDEYPVFSETKVYKNETYAGCIHKPGDVIYVYANESKAASYVPFTEATDKAVPATCTETGLTEGSHCSVCGKVLVAQETVNATGHTEVTDKAVPATCTKTGLTAGSHCSVCGKVFVAQETVNATGHTEVTDKAVPATCTKTGLTAGSHCSVCGEVIVAQETVKATGHKYTSEITTPATCTADGVRKYTCSACGDFYTEAIKATGHTEVTDKAVPATCTKTGLTAGSHCSVCGKVLAAQETVNATGHTEVTDKAVPATCTTDGKTAGSHCSVCGKVLVAQETVNATGHTEVTDKAVSATCTKTGLTAGSHCSVCGEIIVAQETVKATGHTEVTDKAVPATCTTDGKTAGSHCSVCGEILVAQETVNATGHTEVTDKAVPATCTETGLTAGSHCSVCGEILVAQETVKATGHTEVTDKAVPATCTETGLTEGSHCSVCGKVFVAQETVKATGHTYTTKVVAPTYAAQGYTLHTCSVCGDSYKDTYTAQLTVSNVTGLKMTANTPNSISMSWTKVPDATGYVVYQAIDGKWQRIKVTAGNTLTVSNLNAGTNYRFTVKAYVTYEGTNYYSPSYTGVWMTTTPAKPSAKMTVNTPQAIRLEWGKVTGATGYVVYQQVNGTWVKKTVTTGNVYVATGLKSGTNYNFAVRAYRTFNGKNYYSPFATATDTIKTCTKPATVNFTLTAGTKKATVNWSKVTGATGYIVYYKTSANGSWQRLTTTTGTSFTKTGLTSGKTYYFTVKAYKTFNGVTYNASFTTKSVKVK